MAVLAIGALVVVAQPPVSLAQSQAAGQGSNAPAPADAQTELDVVALLGAPPDPANLLGLTPSDVRQLFGDPERVDDVPPALSWHFVGTDCALDLIFYEAVTTRTLRVLTYDVTSTSEDADADASCLQRLLSGDG